jgi:hypothetical protein
MKECSKPLRAGRKPQFGMEGDGTQCRTTASNRRHVDNFSGLPASSIAIIFLGFLSCASVCSAQTSPTLAGVRLTWEVHPLFYSPSTRPGESSQRQVTFTLTTAWIPKTGCVIPAASQTVQEIAGCAIKENYGELCIMQYANSGEGSVTAAAGGATVCRVNAFTVTTVPTDLSLGGSTYAQGMLTVTMQVASTANLLYAYLTRSPALSPFTYGWDSSVNYWFSGAAPTAFREAAASVVAPTVVPLCTPSECLGGTSNLQNYYSPVPTLPLVVVGPPTNFVQAPTFLKVYDLDGHQIQIGTSMSSSASGNLESTAVFFDIDANPHLANGPQVFFNTTGGALLSWKRLEVLDRTFKDFQTAELKPTFSTSSVWNDKQASVQIGFSVVDGTSRCSANNPPPYFWLGSGPARPLSLTDRTEFSCPWNAGSSNVPGCTIPLFARSPLAASNSTSYRLIKINAAFGFPAVDSLCSDADCATNNQPCCCGSRSTKECRYQPSSQGDTANAAAFGLGNPWKIDDVGKFFVTCFVASSELWDIGQATPTQGPCTSLPMCVKVRIAGSSPVFVEPTPLAQNSYDMGGTLVPGRTDVGACLGYPLQLTIKAVDADPGDKVRIFVRKVTRGTGNYEFLPSTSNDAVEPAASCPTFAPYGAQRQGDNQNQRKIESVDRGINKGVSIDSVMAQMEDNVTFADGQAQQSIIYTLSLKDRNGISPFPPANTDGCDTPSGIAVNQSCRLLALNMDQVICGAAYDNSRLRHKRWVGDRNVPNGSDPFLWQRLNALGDLTTAQHCWRIRLQAPPRFLMSQVGVDPVFSQACVKASGTASSTCRALAELDPDSSGLYRNLAVAVGQTLELFFVAVDPNPQDQVSIFVLEDPGLPPNMKVGQSTCIARAGICLAEDRITSSYPAQDLRSDFKFTGTDKDAEKLAPCSRAQVRLNWAPTDLDVGISFKVCLIARDNSPLCFGQGPPEATSRGWFSSRECLQISVFPPKFAFRLSTTNLNSFQPQDVYVGCRFDFEVSVQDITDGTKYGASVHVESGMPTGARLVRDPNCNKATCSSRLIWNPRRGMEGSVYEASRIFTALPHSSCPKINFFHIGCAPVIVYVMFFAI